MRQYPAPHEPYDGSVEDSPIVKLWYGLLADALKKGCERIHIVPSGPYRSFTIRYCTQGAWEEVMTPPTAMYAALLQRLKVMAGFSLARRPSIEQGRFRLSNGGAVFEIGVTVRVQPDGSQDAMVDLPSQPLSKGS